MLIWGDAYRLLGTVSYVQALGTGCYVQYVLYRLLCTDCYVHTVMQTSQIVRRGDGPLHERTAWGSIFTGFGRVPTWVTKRASFLTNAFSQQDSVLAICSSPLGNYWALYSVVEILHISVKINFSSNIYMHWQFYKLFFLQRLSDGHKWNDEVNGITTTKMPLHWPQISKLYLRVSITLWKEQKSCDGSAIFLFLFISISKCL